MPNTEKKKVVFQPRRPGKSTGRFPLYSQTHKLTAVGLRAQGLTYSAIAQEMGCPLSAVYAMCNSIPTDIEDFETTNFQKLLKGYMSDQYSRVSATLLNRAMDDDKLDKASTYQLVMASAVATDKSRLLQDQSTSNISLLSAHINKLSDQEASIDAELRALESELGDIIKS